MSTKKSFRDFEVYQRARALALVIYQATRRDAFSKDYALKDQILRAVGSIPYNIAEGFERDGNKEFAQFLSVSKGSTGEVRAQLDSAADRGHITPEEYRSWDIEAETIGKMLKGLMDYLRESEIRGLKFKQPETRNQKPETRPRRSAAGAAIISVLLVLTVLTIMVVAFLQSMRIDRLTARAYLNKTKAEMLALAASENAAMLVQQTDRDHPVSAFMEVPVSHKGTSYSVPVLVAIQPSPDGSSVANIKYYASSAVDQTGATAPSGGGTDPLTNKVVDTVDVNKRTGIEPFGWIGLSKRNSITGTYDAKPVPVEWAYVKDSNGEVSGRLAFWIDDESARIDVSKAGSLVAASASPADLNHLHQAGSGPSEVSIHVLTDAAESARKFLDFRSLLNDAIPRELSIFQASGVVWKITLPELKAHVTTYSKADERGALGRRRINLNTWAQLKSDVTTPAGRTELVQKVVALGDYIGLVLPDFGKRFYTGSVTNTDSRLYCVKLAANIQDYIDNDRQPTVIRQNLTDWQEPPVPTSIGEGAPINPPAAFGKEVVPAIGEYMGWYYNDGGRLRIDHTFEVWNIHTKSIDLSALGNVRILMAERNDVTPNSGSSAPDPDLPGEPGNPPLAFSISPGTLINAGAHALLTTLPAGSAYDDVWISGTPQRVRLTRSETTYAYGSAGLRMEGDQLATSADVDTEIVVMNDYGYLDIQARVAQQGAVNLRSTDPVRRIGTQSFGNDPSSSGNNVHRRYPLDSGDPRSFTEVFSSYSESGGSPSAIAWRRNTANQQNATKLGAHSEDSTFGIIPNNSGENASYVPEPVRTLSMSSATDAASVIRDGPMATIGELGFVFDPAISGPASPAAYPDIRQRGGFRTLSIGSNFGENLGPARLSHVTDSNKASRLLEMFNTTDDYRSKIHINSLLRDDRNLAIRALVDQLRTQTNDIPDAPTGNYAGPRDPAFPGSATLALQVSADNLVSAIRSRVVGSAVPFLSLGTLQELDIFNTGTQLFTTGTDITTNSTNTNFLDRGREEIFRRLVGLLTLKGSVYRVYAIGQSGQMDKNGNFTPRSTARVVRTFEVQRVYSADALSSTTSSDLSSNNQPTGIRILDLELKWD